MLEGMRAVHATIRAEVRGAGGGTFFLNIGAGRLAAGERPAHPPLLSLVLEESSFANFLTEVGGRRSASSAHSPGSPRR